MAMFHTISHLSMYTMNCALKKKAKAVQYNTELLNKSRKGNKFFFFFAENSCLLAILKRMQILKKNHCFK